MMTLYPGSATGNLTGMDLYIQSDATVLYSSATFGLAMVGGLNSYSVISQFQENLDECTMRSFHLGDGAGSPQLQIRESSIKFEHADCMLNIEMIGTVILGATWVA